MPPIKRGGGDYVNPRTGQASNEDFRGYASGDTLMINGEEYVREGNKVYPKAYAESINYDFDAPENDAANRQNQMSYAKAVNMAARQTKQAAWRENSASSGGNSGVQAYQAAKAAGLDLSAPWGQYSTPTNGIDPNAGINGDMDLGYALLNGHATFVNGQVFNRGYEGAAQQQQPAQPPATDAATNAQKPTKPTGPIFSQAAPLQKPGLLTKPKPGMPPTMESPPQLAGGAQPGLPPLPTVQQAPQAPQMGQAPAPIAVPNLLKNFGQQGAMGLGAGPSGQRGGLLPALPKIGTAAGKFKL